MKDFLIRYFGENPSRLKSRPLLVHGEDLQDCLIVIFGKPKAAVFAHMDTVAFMVRYGQELIEIGSPETQDGYILQGKDSKGEIECSLIVEQEKHHTLYYQAERLIDRGTDLTFKPDFIQDEEYIQSAYLDNRIGLLNALLLPEKIENIALVFSSWEEHRGGSTGYLGGIMYRDYGIKKYLISDVTWVTHGIEHGKGAVISLRDEGIPRRSYVRRIIELARESGVPFQVEVEDAGSSDGGELQKSPFPIDWCFIGAPVSNMHSPRERICIKDFEAMNGLYAYLIERL